MAYKHILIPTDGSEVTSKAVEAAVSLAKALGAQLSAITVKEPFPYGAISEFQPSPPQEFFDAQERHTESRLRALVNAAQAAGVDCKAYAVEAAQPWEAIIEQAKVLGCDLIVMASHGRRGVAAVLIGSQTQRVLHHSPIPVLCVK